MNTKEALNSVSAYIQDDLVYDVNNEVYLLDFGTIYLRVKDFDYLFQNCPRDHRLIAIECLHPHDNKNAYFHTVKAEPLDDRNSRLLVDPTWLNFGDISKSLLVAGVLHNVADAQLTDEFEKGLWTNLIHSLPRVASNRYFYFYDELVKNVVSLDSKGTYGYRCL